MSLTSALTIATSGLAAINRQLAVASQNIASADLPGATQKRARLQSTVADGTGIGVILGNTVRADDPMLRRLFLRASAEFAAADQRALILAPIDAMAGRPEDGRSLAGLTGRLRDAFIALRADPSSAITQTAVVNAAVDVARHLNGLSGAIQKGRQDAHDALRDAVRRGNEALGELGRLNARIVELTYRNQPTGELEDQRDRVVTELAELFGLRPIQQASGMILMVTRNGMVLPNNSEALSIQAANIDALSYYTPGNALRLEVDLGNGTTFELDRTHLGGRAAAAMALRDETLPLMQAELDEFAHKLARRFDQQGLRLFSRADGTIPVENLTDQQGYVGFAREITVYPAILTEPRYVRDGTHAIPGGTPPAFPGGAPNASPLPPGSAFAPNPGGGPAAFDTLIRRILDHALGPTRDAGPPPLAHNPVFRTTGLGPSPNPAEQLTSALSVTANTSVLDYAGMVAAHHALVHDSAVRGEEQTRVSRDVAKNRLADAVGISVDREMALLVELQNAYLANARVLSTVQAMWDALLASVR